MDKKIYKLKMLPMLTFLFIAVLTSFLMSPITTLAYEEGPSIYSVINGDTLYTISEKVGIPINDLMLGNNLSSNIIYPEQKLLIPSSDSLNKILAKNHITNPDLKIIIDKSDYTLSLFHNDLYLKSYHVEFGDGGLGDKNVAGDHKTPEGKFYVSEKSILNPADKYLGSRWLRLSYPNIEDAQRGLNDNLIAPDIYEQIVSAINMKLIPPQDTPLGGGVGIHGGSVPEFGENWTWGCIGLNNHDVQDFYNYVRVGTPVTIQK